MEKEYNIKDVIAKKPCSDGVSRWLDKHDVNGVEKLSTLARDSGVCDAIWVAHHVCELDRELRQYLYECCLLQKDNTPPHLLNLLNKSLESLKEMANGELSEIARRKAYNKAHGLTKVALKKTILSSACYVYKYCLNELGIDTIDLFIETVCI